MSLQLERDVMHLGGLAAHEVHGVMVGAAAHEHEPVGDPVRNAEAEHLAVEIGELLGLVDDEREMAELERPDAGHGGLLAGDRRLLGVDLDGGALGSSNATTLGMPGLVSLRASQRTPSASMPRDVVEFGAGRDLEREPGAARHIALLELDHEIADLGGEVGAAVLRAPPAPGR